MKKYTSILFLVLCFSSAFGQTERYAGFEGRFKSGFLLGHRATMGHLAVEHAFAGEFSYVFRTNGSKIWHQSYKYPEFKISLFAGSVGNKEILGTYYGAYTAMLIPFVAKQNFRLNGSIGCGLGFGTKQYDEIKNPKNVAVSTPLNALIHLGLDARYYFKKNWISLGVDMTHFSNGAFKTPNLGLNLPYLSLAYGRYIRQKPERDQAKSDFITPQRKILFGLTGILSAKEVFPTSGKKYPVYALSVHARTFLKPRVGWELAIDFISKQAIFAYRPEIHKTQATIFQVGVYAGYLLPLDRFHFVLGMGYYVKDRFNPEDKFYHRVGFRYYLKNGINLNLVLKSHWAKADYVEWGVGYCFNYKQKSHEK